MEVKLERNTHTHTQTKNLQDYSYKVGKQREREINHVCRKCSIHSFRFNYDQVRAVVIGVMNM